MSRRAIGTIYADDGANASVEWRKNFRYEDLLFCVDVMQEVLADLQYQYSIMVDALQAELEARRIEDKKADKP